ncbi:MAG: pyridoxal phosphate-dependent aminotransferase [Lachnospiraceae bacterium]|nr:pyridoxal phosphate-dependent aminotransferase [Lachnospiraceae bacterium]
MISKKIAQALEGSSAIRAMFREGKEMASRYGAENVFDFSLGNPATPAPDSVNKALKDTAEKMDPLMLHGYMANAGYEDVRKSMADNLNKRFGTSFDVHNITMTVGAAGGLNIVFKTLLDPGDEVIVFAPYFGEYKSYASNFDAKIVEVEPNMTNFLPNLEKLREKITERTKIVLINTPNNPTGVVYPEKTIEAIAEILRQKEKELKKEIYLVSDEPYRELVYDGAREIFLTKYYRDTIVGYSFSKSLSLPGERIGYVAVPDEAAYAEEILAGLEVSNRILGFVNAPSLIQQVVAKCVDEKTDLVFYDKNRRMLYEGLSDLGFTCIRPQGAFYLWMKSPDEEEERFVQAAKKYGIIMVKGSAFACAGYVRLAYCVSPEMIERSMTGFKKLAKEYGLKK